MQLSFPAELSDGGQGSQNPLGSCVPGWAGDAARGVGPKPSSFQVLGMDVASAEHPSVPCKDPAEI